MCNDTHCFDSMPTVSKQFKSIGTFFMATKTGGVEMDTIDTGGSGRTTSLLELFSSETTHGDGVNPLRLENQFQSANSVGDPGEACKDQPGKASGTCGGENECQGEIEHFRCSGASDNVCCVPLATSEEQDSGEQEGADDNEADEDNTVEAGKENTVGTDVNSLHGHSAEAQELAKAELVKAGHAALQALLDSSKTKESGND
jgi:hypothetical protein